MDFLKNIFSFKGKKKDNNSNYTKTSNDKAIENGCKLQNEKPVGYSKNNVSSKSIKPDGIPSGKIEKQITISPVGITFDCIKGGFSRQDIIANLKEGEIVTIEKYKYKGKDAYMLIGGKYKKDFGVINADLASTISKEYPDKKIEGYIKKRDSFYSESQDDDIETCKVKLYILK